MTNDSGYSTTNKTVPPCFDKVVIFGSFLNTSKTNLVPPCLLFTSFKHKVGFGNNKVSDKPFFHSILPPCFNKVVYCGHFLPLTVSIYPILCNKVRQYLYKSRKVLYQLDNKVGYNLPFFQYSSRSLYRLYVHPCYTLYLLFL